MRSRSLPRAATTAHCAICFLHERKADLKQWLWGQQLADVLHEFPVNLTATELTGMLKRLQPRLYSIASSPKAHPGEVHLTVAAVRYSNGRRHRKGVSSTFLADRAGDVERAGIRAEIRTLSASSWF